MSSIIFVLSWLLPNHYPPWVNFHSEFLAFAGIFLLLGGLIIKRLLIIKIPRITLFLCLLAAIPWVQLAYGVLFFAGDAFISSFYIFGFLFSIVAGYSCTKKQGGDSVDIWLLPAIMLFSAAFLSALIGWMQWLGLPDSYTTYAMQTEPGERIIANLGQPNQLATLLLMGIIGLIFIRDRRLTGRTGFFLGLVTLTWALVLCESRTALLSAVIVTVYLTGKRVQKKAESTAYQYSKKFIWVWLAGFCFATYALPFVNSLLLLEAGRAIEFADNNGRVEIWLQTLAAADASPWIGYGWNQTPVAQATGALVYPGGLAYSNAHNLLLDLVVWVGIPLGLVIFGVIVYWAGSRALAIQKPQSVYAMAMLLPFFVHSLLEFPFSYAYFLLVAGLLVGIVESGYLHTQSLTISKKSTSCILSLFVLLGGFIGYEYLLIEEDYRYARFENLRVGSTPAEYQRPNIYVSTQLAALLRVLRQQAVPGMSAEQIHLLQKVSMRSGMRPLVFRYAVALGLNGDPAGATKQMRLVKSMFGDTYYSVAKTEMTRLATDEYPQLGAVALP